MNDIDDMIMLTIKRQLMIHKLRCIKKQK